MRLLTCPLTVLPWKVLVLCNEFVIHTSLCAVSPPGHTDNAEDCFQPCSLKTIICVALCRQIKLTLLML